MKSIRRPNMKKLILLALVALFSMNAYAFTFGSGTSTPSTATLMTDSIEKDLTMAENLLATSQNLVKISETLLAMNNANEDYIKAMLRLSDDIGKMADRIGEMADRIVYTEVLIGEMADRIVTVSKMIIDFCSQTQKNILQAQQNFNTLLANLK